MKSFVYIIPLTPDAVLTPVRKALREITLRSLLNQTSDNWQALLIGEEEKTEGNLIYIKTNAVAKSEKLMAAFDYLLQLQTNPDFIIRLDDDDIISPFVLERSTTLEFDCYVDLYHSFYDVTSCTISQQKRAWMPNTIIHTFANAMTSYGKKGLPLFAHDHSKSWHLYYAGKKCLFAPKDHPIYLRVISPFTISSGNNSQDINTIDFQSYKKHLISFGKWKSFGLSDFQPYKDDLIDIWENFSGQKINIKNKSFFNLF